MSSELDRRRLILRLLLWSLALAAAAGVVAVLSPMRDILLRVMWTGFATAVACGIAIPLTLMIDRPKARRAGVFGLAAVTLEFLVTLALIWVEGWFSFLQDELLGLTILFIALESVAIGCFLLMTSSVRARHAGYVGVVIAGASFIAFMVAIWLPGRWWRNEEWWGTGWTIGGLGLLAVACLVGIGRFRQSWWRWAGLVATVLAAVPFLYGIWENNIREKNISVPLSLAMLAAYANLVLLFRLKPRQMWVRWAGIASGTIVAALVDVLVFTEFNVAEEMLLRITAAAGILTGCATMAMVVLAAFNRRGEVDIRTTGIIEMSVACPRCGRKQKLPIGKSKCAACNLRIEIRIEEPRCPKCDYLLYRLTSDRCPECGSPVVPLPHEAAGHDPSVA